LTKTAQVELDENNLFQQPNYRKELLGRGVRIEAIKHEGLELPRQDFDRMIKTAAATLASKCICIALGIKADEKKFRFGFAV
jgi:hypothetical protein